MKYRIKQAEFEAIQWTGNKVELLQFFPVDLTPDMAHEMEGKFIRLVYSYMADIYINIGDWLILDFRKAIHIVDDDLFQFYFEKVEGG